MSTKPQSPSGSESSESAKEASRTGLFVAGAVGCLLITGIFEWMSRPAAIEEYGKIGQEFYPEFTDPTTATSLTVSVIDPEEVKPLEFSIKQQENGQWVIPSHHNYPADAADQLAQTAGSVIGIKRGAMVTRWPADHARYGVVDPQTDSVGIDELEGIGKRITFGGKDGEVLASYIVGKKVEGEGNQFYVRHPGEDETYIAELDINLTTRFGDWVNTDLLDITAANVRRLELHDYSFDEMRGTVTGSVDSVLSRETSSEDWKLAGLDDATQEVDTTAVSDSLNTLSNLEIAGVRPKQPGLTADLKIDRAALKSQRDADRLTNDLLARGFLLQPNQSNKDILELIAREGEMFVGTEDGLLYRLYFGRAFTGSSEELEIGLSTGSSEETDAKDDDETEPKVEVEVEETPSGNPGRYVFVRVNFDASLLGEEIKEPVEPKEPEELKVLEEKLKAAAETEEKKEGEDGEDAPEDSEESDESDESDEGGEEAEETDKEKFDRLMIEYAEAKSVFEEQKTAYAEFQKQVEEGNKKAEELNRRFALWYYVIPGDSYDKLSLKRDSLVKAKETEEAAAQQASDNSLPTLGELSEAAMQAAPAGLPGGLAAPANDSTPEDAAAPAGDETAKEGEGAESKDEPQGSDQESTPDSSEKDPATEDASSESEAATEEADADSEAPQDEPSSDDEPSSEDESESDDEPESSDENEDGSETDGSEAEGSGDEEASEEETSSEEETTSGDE